MSVEVASLHAVLGLDDKQFNNALRNADGSMSRFDRSMSGVMDKWKAFGQQAQMASIPIGLALGKGVSDAMSFDSALSEISARTGVVGDDLAEVERLALQMGAATKFSATDAANGMLELMASGDSLEQAMLRIDDVLTLAAVGNIDLKTAADGATDVMAAMRIEADKTGEIVDILAAASGSSSATITDMIEAMATGGNTAANFNINAMDTAATMAILAENSIKGSEAGTALRSMLLNMTRPTEAVQGAWNELGVSMYDAQGNTRDFNTVLLELDAALDLRTPEQQNELMKALAGSYGFTALSALRAAGGIGEMRAAMESQPGAVEIAEAKMNTFEGSLTSLQGSIETLNIKAFRPFMNDVLKPIVDDFIGVINQVADFTEKNPELTQTVIAVAGAFVVGTGALTVLGMVISTVTTGITALIATALSPLGVALAVGALMVGAYMNNWLGFRDLVDNNVRPAIDRILKDARTFIDTIRQVGDLIRDIQAGKYEVGEVLNATANAVKSEIEGNFNRSGAAQVISSAQVGDGGGLLAGLEDAYNEFNNNPFLNPMGALVNAVNSHIMPRADGGGFGAGERMIVGERGPEIVEFPNPGQVIPNEKMGGVTINNLTIHAGAGASGSQIAKDFKEELIRRGYR